MKKILLLLLVIISIGAKAQSTLRLINNTDKKVFAAYTYYSGDDKAWVCEGWYEVGAYGSFDLDLGRYAGKVYIHGVRYAYLGLSEITWGQGYSFCVNDGAFKIIDADKVNCKNKRNFSERNIVNGVNKFEFNP